MGYTRSAIAGFSWQTALKIASALVVVGKLAILTRLLNPEAFGIFSLVMISLGLTEAFTQTGVNVTILQSTKPTKFFINSAWVIAVVRGVLIGALMIGIGWGMEEFLSVPGLSALVVIAALIPVIKGWINPAIVGLQKDLRFSTDTLYRFSLVLVDTVVSILSVWWLQSVTGLIWGMVAAAIFEVVISFVIMKDRPRFRFSWVEAEPILKNARGLGISSLLSYLNENADNLLIGRILGTHDLGLYQPVYGLCHVPNYEVAKSAHHGTMPIYSKVGDDQPRLKKAFLKASVTTLGISLLASLPLILVPGLIVGLIFSDKWTAAVSLLPWLMVAGLLQATIMVCYSLFYAKNKVTLMNVHALVTFVAMMAGIWYFVGKFGLVGTGMGLVASRTIGLPLLLLGTRQALRHA